MPKGESMGFAVKVRFKSEDMKAIADSAKAAKQTVSQWVRSTIHANLAS
jgi:hypothetical protein